MVLKDICNFEIKKGIICKNVKDQKIRIDLNKKYIPKAGDVAVFRIMEIGKHTRIQTINGRNTYILPADLIMGAFGNRYATAQLEGYVPTSCLENYDILGQGAVIGQATSWNLKYEDIGPTIVELVGYVANTEGKITNTINIAEPLSSFNPVSFAHLPKVILSLGTSMDSGKTSSAGFLAHGLKKAGKTVSFIKLTGTTYTKDKTFVKDYGAHAVIDFSDFGFPSTYMCNINELLDLYQSLLNKVSTIFTDYVIVEIADGLLERETRALLYHVDFKQQFYGVLFSSTDSLSAIAGAQQLESIGYSVLGLTGLVTTSPLLVKEIQYHSKYKVLLREDLMSGGIINLIEEKRILNGNDKVEIH